MEEIIKVENLSKVFHHGDNKINVLNDINLTVYKEEILSIVGPSGAGKSTLLYILGLLSEPTNGSIFFKNTKINWSDTKKITKIRNSSIGFIFQFHYLLPDFTALENVMLPAMIKSKDNKIKKDAIDLLSSVGLSNRIRHKPGELSGGEQQRVAIARALINVPDAILADEPTGDLDTVNNNIIWSLLYNVCKEKRITLVVVTHNEEIAKSSDRVINIKDGRIL